MMVAHRMTAHRRSAHRRLLTGFLIFRIGDLNYVQRVIELGFSAVEIAALEASGALVQPAAAPTAPAPAAGEVAPT